MLLLFLFPKSKMVFEDFHLISVVKQNKCYVQNNHNDSTRLISAINVNTEQMLTKGGALSFLDGVSIPVFTENAGVDFLMGATYGVFEPFLETVSDSCKYNVSNFQEFDISKVQKYNHFK